MDSIQEMLDAIDIEQYLDAEGVRYKRTTGSSGAQLNLKECPVCGNSKWKVYLNAGTGLGNCFGGDHPPGQNFSKWNFIKAHLGSPANGAVVAHIKQYALENGWRAARTSSVAVKAPDQAGWQMPASYALPVNGTNLPYLENRGINGQIAQYFHMRICVRGHYRFRAQDGDWGFQDYSRRVLLPVYDLDGTLVTFQGRDITGTQEPKYLFPPGLPGSGKFLYNGLNAIGTKRVVIGEGAFDVAALKIAFDQDPALRDVVPIGTFGKHLSKGEDSQLGRMLELKARGIDDVTLMWDGEIQATLDAIDAAHHLLEAGFKVRIGMLPADKDPNEVPAAVVRDTYYSAMPFEGRVSGLRIATMRHQINSRAA